MATASPTAAFNFFNLPRELRDEVYSYLSSRVRFLQPPRKGNLEVTGLPMAPVLAATKQLRMEYRDHLNKTKAKMKVHGCFVWPKYKLPPQLCSMIREIHLDIRISCDQCPVDDPFPRCSLELRLWIAVVRSMFRNLPNVSNLFIRIGLPCRSGQPPLWPYLSHGEPFRRTRKQLLLLPHIKRIDMLQCESEEQWAEFSKGSALTLPRLATWNVQPDWTGWEVHPRIVPG